MKQPDILAIQELKLATDKVPTDMFTSRGYHLAVHGQNNGMVCCWPPKDHDIHQGLPNGDEGGQSRLVAGTIDGIRFVNCIAPKGSRERQISINISSRFLMLFFRGSMRQV